MFEGALPAPVEKSILVLLGLTFLGVLANLYRRLWNSVTGLVRVRKLVPRFVGISLAAETVPLLRVGTLGRKPEHDARK